MTGAVGHRSRWPRTAPPAAGVAAGARAWATAGSACRWPSSRCRCTWCCRTTTPAQFGVPLALLGAVLLARGCSTRWSIRDRPLGRSPVRPLGRSGPGWSPLARLWCWRSAFAALFFPPVQGHDRAAGLVRCTAGRDLPGLQRRERGAPGLGRPARRRRSRSARAWWPGAKAWRWSACWWPACCRRWPGLGVTARWCLPCCCWPVVALAAGAHRARPGRQRRSRRCR